MMITLAAISLAAPVMLLGIAAIALPIAAHLMNRRTRQRLVFPTIRLLTESRATQSSLYRIRRWILLLLRCLALILIAMAFTMPSCTPQVQPDAGEQGGAEGAAVVFILDASVSLDRDAGHTGGTTLVHSMRAMVERTLSTLKPGADRVNVIFAASQPRALFQMQASESSLTGNHQLVREGVAQFELTQDRADLPAALAMAGQMLHQVGAGVQRRIVIISDMQQSNWQEVSLASSAQALLPAGVVVTVLPLDAGEGSNVALSDVRCEPVMPVLNQQALLIVRVTNHANEARDVTVSAQLDGQPIGVRTLALLPRESREVGFEAMLTTPGLHRAEFSLPVDALPADNKAYLAFTAVQRVPVILVGDDDRAELGSASYFIARALSPRGDAGDLMEVRQMSSVDLAEADVNLAQAIIISQVEKLSDRAAAVIIDYLHRGGGVLFYSDGLFAPANLAALQKAADAQHAAQTEQDTRGDGDTKADIKSARIVPWMPVSLREFATSEQQQRITQGQWNSPLLTEFDEASRTALSQVRFRRTWTVEDVNPAASVLLTFGDGTPALGVSPVGEGRLVVANFSPALTASDIGKYGSFVALSHSLARYMRPRHDWRTQLTVSQPIVTTAAIPVGEEPGSFIIEGPDGQVITPDLARAGARMSIATGRTKASGFYRVVRNDKAVGDIAVNLDPRESDLRVLDDDAIAGKLKSPQVTVQVKTHAAEGDVLQVRGEPLWHWFVIAAMMVLGLELALLSVWNR